MKLKKFLVAAVCGIISLTAVFGLAACQKGDDGAAGKSAYEIAVDNGFQGTEQEWLDSLKGSSSGSQGKSAYDIWLENGHTGSEADFLEWLKGEKGDKGDPGDPGAQGNPGAPGNPGTAGKDGSAWLVGSIDPRSVDGKDGDLYLNISTWDVWHKVSGEWTLLGNIKGADGTG
ncbi:MAG: collagen-like protein, partial [Clostridiales bacterium]|nr:collagen-like protein [Clostridiales bacterium]